MKTIQKIISTFWDFYLVISYKTLRGNFEKLEKELEGEGERNEKWLIKRKLLLLI